MKFDPKALTKKGQEIKSVSVEGIGEVRYGQLTIEDLLAVFGEGATVDRPDPTEEQSLELGWRLIHKAYPDFTMEDMMGWIPTDMQKVFDAMFNAEDFRESD